MMSRGCPGRVKPGTVPLPGAPFLDEFGLDGLDFAAVQRVEEKQHGRQKEAAGRKQGKVQSHGQEGFRCLFFMKIKDGSRPFQEISGENAAEGIAEFCGPADDGGEDALAFAAVAVEVIVADIGDHGAEHDPETGDAYGAGDGRYK